VAQHRCLGALDVDLHRIDLIEGRLFDQLRQGPHFDLDPRRPGVNPGLPEIVGVPDLLRIQTESFRWFMERGLKQLLERYGCPLSPREVEGALAAAIRREHQRRRAQGADFPEVRIERLWAELLDLDPTRARAFAVEHEALTNPVWPMPGLRGALRSLRRLGLLLGILSNAQFFTPLLFECFLGESPQALGFREDLTLYSCQLGLAKPAPRLFEIARERLAGAGVPAAQVLMVGNDALRDLAPARAAGFQTALFAGDARSLRGAQAAGETTAVITDLRQLPRLLERG
jgi:putative hydrolase of the HAD superfamily